MRELKLNLLEDEYISIRRFIITSKIIQQKINQSEDELKNGINERRILINKIILDLGYLDDDELKILKRDTRCNIYNKIRGRQN